MKDLKPTCRVAVIQAAPLLFRKDACVEKAAGTGRAGGRCLGQHRRQRAGRRHCHAV